MTPTTTYLLERAWVDGSVQSDVLVEVTAHGLFGAVTRPGLDLGSSGVASLPADVVRLPGLTVPGLANCHSHAFHRALRGRTQRERGSFWTWREQMYAVAGTLDPDSYYWLARATYREMAAAGITTVGEFHYLHHQADGTPYDERNAMAKALVAAAHDAGIRIALLDTCYLSSGFGAPLDGVQRRFGDRSVDGWYSRMVHLEPTATTVVGAAVHSVRALTPEQIGQVGDLVREHTVEDPQQGFRSVRGMLPLHVHLSEQVAENDACRAAYGLTPTGLLAERGVLGERTSLVHATHLTDDDVRRIGESGAHSCFCPTTERDLGDGIGPSRALREAGSPLTLGSDSHAVIDLFEEMRAVELDERLATQQRGHWTAAELLEAATATGHASLGFPGAGRIERGARADLVTLDLTSPRTAGTGRDENTAVFAAAAEDVTHVVVDGRVVVRPGDRADIGRELDAAIDAVWRKVP
ncbi:formimidoylglutamate deiminase [Nocardioides sp. KIGAM211]|uniref:Formimidoylglutamate deiminase n=1 Tax=Nocardioides luti TaxID=2761101 RepID=A0A7X0RHN5_9ACTN|nr:formimidoylglutamate deiminase [Nocardioides luti]MBB6628315.1 formimidoylglutamate deiminase [Nocardioides luti]